jgi:putative two-component system response regulator
LDTLNRLTRAAEYKDHETRQHIVRIGYFAGAIARAMELDPPLVATLTAAAPMHDIGKIGIPDSILLKPGKFTPSEREIMERHTDIGADILRDAQDEFTENARLIALTHHEKWNGTGYPARLIGEAIPLCGRIVAVADVFDALTSRRPYKEPFSIEESFEIMRQGRGSHFDPEVLDAFFYTQDEIIEIKQGHSDDVESLFTMMMDYLKRSK